jgi:hypothetical protein
VIYAKRVGELVFREVSGLDDVKAWLRGQDAEWEGEVFVVNGEVGRRWSVVPARHGVKVLDD